MSARGLNLLVFRDGRRQVLAADLRHALMEQLKAVEGGSLDSRDSKIAALLRAGELECGVADVNSKCALPFAGLTDCLAEILVGNQPSDFPAATAPEKGKGAANNNTPSGV